MSRRKRTGIADKLEGLAEKICDELTALTGPEALEQQIDGFKALTTYRLGMGRLDAKLPPDDDDSNVATFKTWSNKLKEIPSG